MNLLLIPILALGNLATKLTASIGGLDCDIFSEMALEEIKFVIIINFILI
jgi:hypothetical protein